MFSCSSFLCSKTVFDADRATIGRVAGAERHPDTRDTMSLLVQLEPEAAVETGSTCCWLPVDRVQGIRRNGIHLTERLSAILREAGRRGAHPSARR